jgi:putative transposase
MGVVINELGENSHYRKSVRLSGYDYSEPNGYFITISTFQHIEFFGEIVDSILNMNTLGKIVWEEWLQTPNF